MPPRLPTSRDYWNLRAEQVMDRVFNDGDNVLETVQIQVHPQTNQSAHKAQAAQTDTSKGNPSALTWPQVGLVGLGLIAVLGSSGLAIHWKLTQQALEREGNLALIERLRNNPSANTEAGQGRRTAETAPASAAQGSGEEATTTNPLSISPLPNTATTLEPVTVPLSAAEIPTNAPVAGEGSALAPQPLLVGVVHGGHGDGSAIFQLGNLSLSTVPGEVIGNSGWTLRSVSANGAVIERAGATQSLSVGGAF